MRIEPKDGLKDAAFIALFFVIAFASFSISLFEIASALFMGLVMISLFRTRHFFYFRTLFVYLALFYFACNLLSLTQSDYLQASWRGIFKVLKNILICFSAIYVLDSEEKLKKVFEWLLIVATVIALDALIQGMSGVELIRGRHMTPYWGEIKRWTGPFSHANDFSAYLSVMTLLFLGILRDGARLFGSKKYVFFLTGFVISALCLAGTYSRGAWLSVAISAILLTLFQKNKWLAGLISIVVIAGIFVAPASIKIRVSSLWDTKNGTIIEREELWSESLRMIRKNPWLGMGVNTYAKNEPNFKSKTKYTDNQYAHNGYLQMAAEIGLIGLSSFLAMMVYFFASALPVFLRSKSLFLKTAGLALCFGTFSFLIHSATDTDLQSLLLVNTLWLVTGAVWAAKRCSEKA